MIILDLRKGILGNRFEMVLTVQDREMSRVFTKAMAVDEERKEWICEISIRQ